ncbi:hypothetical protein [Roseibium album]|uniref:Uncharacterized protein n=1 Tax=Roseibium album TaxID=311410 RepID=A0A0M7AYR2_9HYPH|nr:hypothetical protein [Roseibium album]CTQ61171.1 hypothetical protein LA5094_03949 [Roseibium album]CTQ67555.1 hypothetical protein LA5096_01489 [Roseibium album]CTQ78853.1 hypothetical protein LA5095_04510 [Roseibium album]
MKILKIEKEQGYFCLEQGSEWKPIDSIDKVALLKLLDLYLENDVEMDSPDEQSLSNQAHAIIYRGIFDKLSQLVEEKSRFKDESETLYLDEMKKYAAQ